MRQLRDGLWVAELLGTQVTRVRRRVALGLQLSLGRMGYELVLSRSWIEDGLTQLLLLIGRKLGLDMDLTVRVNETTVVRIR